MEQIKIEKLDITIYHQKLNNGLSVYLVPKDKENNIYATLTTKYGSNDIEFIPNGENDFYKSPNGVAHFLEHKLFEQKNGDDPFSFFAKSGCSNNAYTNFHNTTYLFSGMNEFEKNIEYLLDFVQEPYFTDENVEKEKGIIIEELKMYLDNPYRLGLEKILSNSFSEIPIKIPTIGTVSSIKSITKEDLYTCYNTFYHPGNMILVIAGNIDVEKTMNIIISNQEKKEFPEFKEIKLKQYEEPLNVIKEKETINMNVTIPKLMLGYKINIKDLLKKYPKYILFQYIGMYFECKISSTAPLMEQLKKDGIINTNIDFSIVYANDFIECIIISDTMKPDILKEKINNYLIDKETMEEDFLRKKKNYLSSNIYMSDNIFGLNNKIINNIVLNGNILTDIYGIYNRLQYNEFLDCINSIDFSNQTTLIIKPLNACQEEKNKL